MTVSELNTTLVPLADLTEHPRNARSGNVPKIMESLELHGQYRALVVQKSTMFVCAGNHTLKAMRRLGWDTAACHVLDLTDEQALRILLVDNRSSDEATYDYEALADILDELQASGGGLLGTGYDDGDHSAILADLADASGERVDPTVEWQGMPDYQQDNLESVAKVQVHFRSEDDADLFYKTLGRERDKKPSMWWPEDDGHKGKNYSLAWQHDPNIEEE